MEFGGRPPNDYYQVALNGDRSVKFAQSANERWIEGRRRDLLPGLQLGNVIRSLKVVRREELIHIFVNGLHAATI